MDSKRGDVSRETSPRLLSIANRILPRGPLRAPDPRAEVTTQAEHWCGKNRLGPYPAGNGEAARPRYGSYGNHTAPAPPRLGRDRPLGELLAHPAAPPRRNPVIM